MPQAPSLILSQGERGFAFLHRARSRAAPLDGQERHQAPLSPAQTCTLNPDLCWDSGHPVQGGLEASSAIGGTLRCCLHTHSCQGS